MVDDELEARARNEAGPPEPPNVPLDLRDAHGGPGAIGDRVQVGPMDAELDHDPRVDAPERVERPHRAIGAEDVAMPDRSPYEPVGDLTQPPSGVTGEPPPTGPIAPREPVDLSPEGGKGSWGSS